MTSPWIWLAAVAVAAFGATALLTGLVLGWLRRRQVLDRPNARSLHAAPVPRGGGIAMLPVLIAAWALIALAAGELATAEPATSLAALWPVLAAAVLLAAVSWIDDLKGLSPALRLPVHALAVAVGIGMAVAAGAAPVFQGLLPPWLDAIATFLLWLWFLNLFNFMDGIDAIAGVETAAIGLGIALVVLLAWPAAAALPMAALAVALAGAALGFLVWNRPPARLFLGDVGSIPLGYLAGFLLIEAARGGAWAAALILPAVFLADATWTLAARSWRGANVLEAHAEHFYQRAVREAGRSHGQVALAVAIANLALIGLAIAAELRDERPMALAGAAAVLLLLARRVMRPAGEGR